MSQTCTAQKPSSCILPLPDDVVAQIKSSTAIVSLTDVVLELLKNSLDARATKVEASVDFARGACTVEDDGRGIPPLEFTEDGGLGRRYCTSKHNPSEPLLGRHGTFLASLSAVSLLSVTSRHCQHRSHNSVTFHHAKTVRRQLPAESHHHTHEKHGTRVTVRNLFGNLPVRVKQRSKAAEHRSEHDRLWEKLKSSVAALLLSWSGSVSLRVQDAQNRIRFAFNTSNSWLAAREKRLANSHPPSSHLTCMLAILTQANYISVTQWPTWIPVSASTPSLSIQGVISLEPAPTRSIQFISLGIRPLSADGENNELYNQVNRLFRHSSFGIEEEHVVSEPDKDRQSSDKRLNRRRQFKMRKGVDRYPMFHLRIALREGMPAGCAEDELVGEETNLQAVVEVLGAMIVQWLKAHHFSPVSDRPNRKSAGASVNVPVLSSEDGPTSSGAGPPEASSRDSLRRVDFEARNLDAKPTLGKKRKRSRPSECNVEKPGNRAFAEWSRIKSGKTDFFNIPATLQIPEPRAGTMTQQKIGAFDNDNVDESLVWVDPTTKKAHVLNARTGCVMPLSSTRPATHPFTSPLGMPHAPSKPSLRLAPKTAAVGQTPWLDGILQTWTNPVFRTNEQRIEQILPQDDKGHNLHHQCCSAPKDAAQFAHPLTKARLSKECLVSAEVLAQVDKKFILVKMRTRPDENPKHDAARPLLVLIDQHAADERIRVEALLRELCSPMDTHCSGYQSKLGHRALVGSVMLENPPKFTVSRQEQLHFATYADRFASWGILFDFVDSATNSVKVVTSEEPSRLLCVTALPPGISERCQADAQLLISFLRTAVWKYANDLSLSTETSLPQPSQPLDWIGRLGHCPEGLVDIINSRACRSAIMFNDELDMHQSRGLVQKLATCAFPFVCAHGRPSMVPLGDIGSFAENTQALSLALQSDRSNFVHAWKHWAQ
ncbi:hypothetical protein HBI06_173950 [Parastagonospora nodorum]|nr:hypothetical protein HBH42_082630 [Parastagonospora nodorum]KAH4220241.1 hypothetical protein HBI06_173950 [Parastagonospora nodorum]KAH4232825.1 hypothetical protein HBI05_170920 [Parastagonospora nodorum]KAH5534320.1 hypothetical protein HBI27_186400 [Parastagonospora nodorum]